jgi:hypothetical protein
VRPRLYALKEASVATAPAARHVPGHEIHRRVQRERAAHLAIATAVAIAPQLYATPYAELGAIGAVAATGVWLYSKTKPDPQHGIDSAAVLRASQKSIPVLGYAGAYLADVIQHLHGGFAWWQLAVPVVWGAVMAAAAPVTRSLGLVPEHHPVLQQTPVPRTRPAPARRRRQRPATTQGSCPGCGPPRSARRAPG